MLLLAGTATPVRAAGPDAWTQQALFDASTLYNIDLDELTATANCESGGFRPDVVYGPTRGSAGEGSVMQFLGDSRHHLWRASPYAEQTDVWDPRNAIFVAAWAWARNYYSRCEWSCWRLLFDRRGAVCYVLLKEEFSYA